jgi:CRP-like cAMP-binding protein
MYALLLHNIARYVTLSPGEEQQLLSALQYRKIPKRTYLLQEGEVCRYDYFILQGCLRQYEVDEAGREHIVQLGFEDWWISDWHSLLTHTPSAFNIDALEDAAVAQISKEALDQLFIEVPALNTYYRIILQRAFAALQKRVLLHQKTAEERYRAFREVYGYFEQRVSQQHIASYLGITRESLSRLKKQLSGK